MNLILFDNPRQQISTACLVCTTAELARRGGGSPCCSVHLPWSKLRCNRSLFHHGLGRGSGVGRGLGDGVDLGVTVGVAVGVGLGITVDVGVGVVVGLGVSVGVTVGVRVGVALGDGVGLGEHTLSTSTKRATVCWFPWSVISTPVTRKPPSF